MQLTEKYCYRQTYLPTKRHRIHRERYVEDTINVNITELKEEEFPIAFIVHEPVWKETLQDNAVALRTYKGRLYKPVRVFFAGLVYGGTEYVKSITCVGEHRHRYDAHHAEDFTEQSIVIEDNKSEVRKEINKTAHKYIRFDGNYWEVCSEPRYVIVTFGLGHNHGSTGLFVDDVYNPNIPSRNYFNALQHDEAIAYGKEVAIKRGDTNSVDGMGKLHNIEVLMPEMVKLNPRKEHNDGDPFLNDLEELINVSSSVTEAGLLCIAKALKG